MTRGGVCRAEVEAARGVGSGDGRPRGGRGVRDVATTGHLGQVRPHREGHARVEVEAVFGPPGNFSGEDVVYEIESAQRVSWIPTGASCDGDIEGWLYDEARVVVFFDDAGRAIEKAYAPRSRNGPVGDYLRRVRRAWRKW
jgi:hypothetical protein